MFVQPCIESMRACFLNRGVCHNILQSDLGIVNKNGAICIHSNINSLKIGTDRPVQTA